jgi:7tm Odorant receptor
MDPDFKFNWRTTYSIILIVGYLVCTAYTLATVEADIKWHCLSSVGLGAQGSIKYRAVIYLHKQAYIQIVKIKEMYLEGHHQGHYTDYCKLLTSCVNVCNKVLNVYMLIFACGFVVLLSYPIIMLFAFDKKEFLVVMYLPGIDPFGQLGFVLHSMYHTFLAVIACVGTPAADFYFLLCIAHIYVYIESFHLQIKSFNKWLLENGVHDRDWQLKVTEKVDEILKEHQNLLIFMDHLDEFYFLAIAVHIGTATVSLGITLYLIVTVSTALL